MGQGWTESNDSERTVQLQSKNAEFLTTAMGQIVDCQCS